MKTHHTHHRPGTAALLAASLATGIIFPAANAQSTPDPTVTAQANEQWDGLPARQQGIAGGGSDALSDSGTNATNDINLEGYDYGQVIDIFEHSLSPVKTHLADAMRGFDASMQEANARMAAGDHDGAIAQTLQAIDRMTALRDRVVEPLLAGQENMIEAMAPLRLELAEAFARPEPVIDANGVEDPLGPIDTATREHLKRLAHQHRAATTDNQRRTLERKFRTAHRIAQLRARVAAAAPKLQDGKRKLLNRLDHMLAVLGELSTGAELVFASLESQRELCEQYRQGLALVESAQEAEKLLREGLGGSGGFAESIARVEGNLEGFSVAIDDHMQNVLDELGEATDTHVGGGLPGDPTTTDLMSTLLEEGS